MAEELLFSVAGPVARPAEPISLAEAGLKERADLQEWVIAHPEILGAGVKIVTFEFDRWLASSGPAPQDRLDVLGLDGGGRLVVAELKRDKAPDATEMQAIKYAAMASRFTMESLADQHARFRAGRAEKISSEEALAELRDHAPDLSIETLRRPRIVLLAREYPMVVTASAVWLSEMGLDISLVKFQAYRSVAPGSTDEDRAQLLVTVSQLYPVRDVEDFMVSPQRQQAQELTRPLWDEITFLDAAVARRTGPEVAFIRELLADVHAHGERLGWGRAPTPGVSGRYSVGGAETMVWIINVGTGLLEFRMWYVASRLEAAGLLDRLETAAEKLASIPKAAGKIEDARTKHWRTSLYFPLTDIVPGNEGDFISAIHAVTDPAPGSS